MRELFYDRTDEEIAAEWDGDRDDEKDECNAQVCMACGTGYDNSLVNCPHCLKLN